MTHCWNLTALSGRTLNPCISMNRTADLLGTLPTRIGLASGSARSRRPGYGPRVDASRAGADYPTPVKSPDAALDWPATGPGSSGTRRPDGANAARSPGAVECASLVGLVFIRRLPRLEISTATSCGIRAV